MLGEVPSAWKQADRSWLCLGSRKNKSWKKMSLGEVRSDFCVGGSEKFRVGGITESAAGKSLLGREMCRGRESGEE